MHNSLATLASCGLTEPPIFFQDGRRTSGPASDDRGVNGEPSRQGAGLLEIYDRALPQVYGYLISRCGQRSVAEDLTSETFLAAARQWAGGPGSIPWLIGIARHKLVDHWRRQAREERLMRTVASAGREHEDPWDAELEVLRARQVLAELAPQHRAALTLRYLDGLSVGEAASVLGRTLDATEALLVRARRANSGGPTRTEVPVPDPLDALRMPIGPLAPDPRFAAQLRRRLELALVHPEGQEEQSAEQEEDDMSETLLRDQLSRNGSRHGDVSYITLAVADAAATRRFYGQVLGWTFGAGQVESAGNQTDQVIPQVGLWPEPEWRQGVEAGAILSWRVDDITAAVERVRGAGGTATEPAQLPYGLQAECSDGSGLRFWLHELPPPGRTVGPNGERHGDISYVVLRVADLGRARELFADVLGWSFAAWYRRIPGGGAGADDRDERGQPRSGAVLPRGRHLDCRRARRHRRRPGRTGRIPPVRARIALRRRPGHRVLPAPTHVIQCRVGAVITRAR